MFNDHDLAFFEKYQISVSPEFPKEKLGGLENMANNPFLYLERNDRFLKCEFIKFPDEQRQLTYQGKHYFCFGKDAHNCTYFTIGQGDGVVYEFRKNEVVNEARTNENDYLVIFPTNNNIANFTTSYHYFLMAIYQLLTQIRQIKYNNCDDMAIYEKIAEEFKENIQKFDTYAFADDNHWSYWGMVYNMLLEADLAFYLPSVSLMDYMNTERF